jgi:hypothetical protein
VCPWPGAGGCCLARCVPQRAAGTKHVLPCDALTNCAFNMNPLAHPVFCACTVPPVCRRYEGMTAEEVQLDRYSKFRKLGMWEEFLVAGGKNKEAREALESGERGRGWRELGGCWRRLCRLSSRLARALGAPHLPLFAFVPAPLTSPSLPLPLPLCPACCSCGGHHRCRHLGPHR